MPKLLCKSTLSKMWFFTVLLTSDHTEAECERTFYSSGSSVSYVLRCLGLCHGVLSWRGVQSKAEPSERSTWGRRWPRRSPQEGSSARARASHNKSGPPQRNVPSVLGWCRSLYRCSTRGDGTCLSALPPSPWSRDMNDTLNLTETNSAVYLDTNSQNDWNN